MHGTVYIKFIVKVLVSFVKCKQHQKQITYAL